MSLFEALVLWCSASLTPSGPLVLWSLGRLITWFSDPLVPWSSGPLVPWSSGPLVLLSTGSLTPWSSSPLSGAGVLVNRQDSQPLPVFRSLK